MIARLSCCCHRADRLQNHCCWIEEKVAPASSVSSTEGLFGLVCVRTPRDYSCCVLPAEFADAGYRRTDRTGQRCTHLLCRSCHHRHVVSWRSPLRGDGRPDKLLPPHCQRGEHPAGGVRGVGTAGRVSVTSRHCCGFQSKLSEARRRRGIVGCRSPCFSSHSFLTHVFHFQPGLPTLFL